MKKTLLMLVLALFAVTTFAQNEETENFRVPNGYQGFVELGNSWHFDKNMPTTIQFSTTHGFIFEHHVYAGIGAGLEFNTEYAMMPFYANFRYVFCNKSAINPFVSMRLGSYISDKMGAYGDLAVGVRFASKRDFAVSIMLSGTYYDKLKYEYYDDYQDYQGYWHHELVESQISPSGITLKVGIEW